MAIVEYAPKPILIVKAPIEGLSFSRQSLPFRVWGWTLLSAFAGTRARSFGAGLPARHRVLMLPQLFAILQADAIMQVFRVLPP